MARSLRINYPGAFYHITSRGNERKNIFTSQRDREKFLEYLESATSRYEAVIHVYCLMDNHYHLLLETPAGNLPRIMRHINGAYTTYYNVKRKRFGHLFQGRYKSVLVDADEYAKELSRYIHLNPVRAKMVEKPEDYKWSSYGSYIGKESPPEWLRREFILGYFGENESSARKGYKEFVDLFTGMKYESPLLEAISSTILGAADFVEFIKETYIKSMDIESDIPALKELSVRITVADIIGETDKEFGKDSRLARSIAIYLSQKHTWTILKDIGADFGIGESGVSQTSRRVREKIEKDKKLRKRVGKVEGKLNLSRMKN
jgi:REP element-mobilizing transposase RayT